MTLVRVLLFAVAVAIAAFFLFRSPTESPAPLVPRVGSADSPPRGEREPDAALGVDERRTAETPELPALGAALVAGASAAAAEEPLSAEVALEGTVVLLGENGEASRGESGAITIRVFPKRGERHELDLPIFDGRFTALVPRESDLQVTRIELSDHPVQPMGLPRFFPPPADGALEIECRAVKTLLIRVEAAATGKALDGVTVVSRNAFPGRAGEHPGPFGPDDVVITGASSPVSLPLVGEFSPFNSFSVRAAGYGWAHVAAHEDRVETTVALHPAADLLIHFENLVPHPEGRDPATRTFWERNWALVPFGQPILLVEREGGGTRGTKPGEIFTSIPDPDAPSLIEGLAPGAVVVRAVLHSGSGTTVELARAEVRLVAGEIAEVVLQLDSTPLPAQRVPLSGTLEIGPGWDPPRMAIAFRPRLVPWSAPDDVAYVRADACEPVAGSVGLFRFDAGLVLPGTYSVDVGWITAFTTVDVGAAGCLDLALRLPAAADVALRLIDSDTRRAVTSGELTVAPNRDDGGGGARMHLGAPTDGHYSFQCLPGRIWIESAERGVEFERAEFEIAPGRNELTVEARLVCGISLYALSSRRAFASPAPPLTVSLQREGSADAPVIVELDGGEHVSVRLDAPGRYVGVVTTLHGDSPTAPFTVDVIAGTWTRHSIVLDAADDAPEGKKE